MRETATTCRPRPAGPEPADLLAAALEKALADETDPDVKAWVEAMISGDEK